MLTYAPSNKKGVIPMYTEERSGFPIKDLLLKMLLLTIFMGLLIWIYPMPKGKNVDINDDLEPIVDRIFIENIKFMQDAAIKYYTNERLPKELGQKTSMTLKEMLDKKLILPFVDKNGNSCDVNSSYVEVTRMETEFILKVYLECGHQKDYILVNLGCNNKCFILKEQNDKVAEKPKQETKKTIEYQYMRTISSESWTPFGDWTDEKKAASDTVKVQTKELYKGKKWVAEPVYSYEYEKTIYGEWGQWSAWSTKKQTPGPLKEERTRTVQNVTYGPWVTTGWTTEVRPLSDTRQKVDQKTEKEYTTWSSWRQKCYETLQSQYNSDKTIERQGPLGIGTDPNKGTLCYIYNIRTRSIINTTYYKYKERTKTVTNIKEYSYRTKPFDSKKVTEWFTTTPSSEWTATGNKKQISDEGGYIYTNWLEKLPSGYTLAEKKTKYRYSFKKVNVDYEYMWSTKTNVLGWKKTGKTRTLAF
jgi:hypothetical protein